MARHGRAGARLSFGSTRNGRAGPFLEPAYSAV